MRITTALMVVLAATEPAVPTYSPAVIGNTQPARLPTPGKRQKIANKKRNARRGAK